MIANGVETDGDPIVGLDAGARARLAQIADQLIPAAHGMPSAAEVLTDDRLRFVLRSRPDLRDPLVAALRADVGTDVDTRLAALAASEPDNLAALQLVIVAGYYTDKRVRELIGYPGQMALDIKSWLVPAYLEEGLIDKVLERGPVWRDPSTGRRAVVDNHARTYAERFTETEPLPKQETMVATAPEAKTQSAEMGWLDPFLARWQTGGGDERKVNEPATGRFLLTIRESTREDVARAAAAAAAAQPAWAETSYEERSAVLRRAAEIYEEHRPEFGTWTQRETGAHHNKVHHEQNFTVGELLAASAMPWQPYGSLVPSVQQDRLSMVRRIPVGVVGAITPWNSPSVLGMRVVAPALALGNAVILKPDPQTPVCGGAVFAAIFKEAGLPDGVLQVVIGDAETGDALITDRNVNMVSFTGSTEVGRIVGAKAGGLLKKVSLELGGNNPLIVLDDADLPAAASAGAYASFQFQGQVCFATGRHIVHASVADEYVDLLARTARRLRTGDPYREDVELGPIVNERQLQRVDDIVRRSIENGGARLVEGGTYEGLFYRPTVLADVKLDAPAWTEEVFGPVAPVVRFATDDEAVELANSSEYGLAAGVYSRSISHGLSVANRIRAGMVHVNDQTINDEATIPFGGVGLSGNGGRFGPEANLEAFTQFQWVTVRDEGKSFGPTY